MTLDFTQLTEQVERMGREIGSRRRTLAERARIARQKLRHWSGRLDEVAEHVNQAGADFRGAAPLRVPYDEPMADSYPLPLCPEAGTLVAVDGSQVYLDEGATALYYLINLGVIVYHHGIDVPPNCEMAPQLFYHDDHIYAEGRLVNNVIVNARRTKFERDKLAEAAWNYRHAARPLLAVADGPLLFWMDSGVPEEEREEQIMPGYYTAMQKVRNIGQESGGGTAMAGYVDKPNSSYVVRLLQLLPPLDPAEDTEILEGLTDQWLFSAWDDPLLPPGARSALFVQQSPYNARYAERDPDLQIVFFYLNVATVGERPYIARVELPMWVARNRQLVSDVHALIYSQCLLYGRYPYILARADELAVVRGHEREQLDNLVDLALRREGEQPGEASVKAEGKEGIWRAQRTRYKALKGWR